LYIFYFKVLNIKLKIPSKSMHLKEKSEIIKSLLIKIIALFRSIFLLSFLNVIMYFYLFNIEGSDLIYL